MKAFGFVFCGGLGIVCSLAGWGWLAQKILGVRNASVGQTAALGLALSTVVGGLLNVTQTISPRLILAYLSIGFCISAVVLLKEAGRVWQCSKDAAAYFNRHKLMAALVGVLCLIVWLKYSAAVSPGWFHPLDDYHGYFVFPVKMIQTGSMGIDPFSERRMVASLGGKAFLDTFSLVLGDVRNLDLMDMGVAFVIVVLLLVEIAFARKLAPIWTVLILIGVAFYNAPVANITAVYCSAALLVLLFEVFRTSTTPPGFRQSAVIALVLASLMSLKTSLVPAAVLFWVGFFAFHLISPVRRIRTLLSAVLCAAMTVVFLLPWMAASYQSSGTTFYPFLGEGFHGSRYGTFLRPTDQLGVRNVLAFFHGMGDVLFAVMAVQAVLLIIGHHWNTRKDLLDIIILANGVLAILAIGVGTAGYQLFRYSFPIAFAVVIYLLMEQLTAPKFPGLGFDFHSAAVSLLLLGLFLGGAAGGFFGLDWDYSLAFSLKGDDIVMPSEISAYRRMQMATPRGQVILARLDKNFLLDFNRNPVYVVDTPGASSPPPGMPVSKGPERLADYLVEHGVRYVAYSYGDEAGFSHKEFDGRLNPNVNAWIRSQAQNTFEFQDNLAILGNTRRKLFDDGRTFVLDLCSYGGSK